WRDRGGPYRVGPSVQFHDRAVFSRGKKLVDVPENAWIGVEMRAPLGAGNSQWELTVTLPDGTKREIPGLVCDKEWKEVRWVGFTAATTGPAVFQLDDVVMLNE
ncbi:MAG TPA: hypothetical protein VNZ22_09685, partial [Bacillota bacterium]|nr:hypothetical protein [Bacillota bacterium]